jgi:hypothetical protein
MTNSTEFGLFTKSSFLGGKMKIAERSNRFYDITRFGHAQIRIYRRKGTGKKCPRYLLKCGCCDQKLEIHYAEDGLEIGGVNGALEDWREILLPLLKRKNEKPRRNLTG